MGDSSLIRVLVAEDSPTVRYHLAALINEMPGLRVIGEARDGQEVVEMAQRLKPSVISMDVRMPRQDGLEATRQIMSLCPTPIVVVSGLLDDDIDLAMRALQAGALAVVEKPPARREPSFAAKQRHLVNTLTAMAAVSVIRRWEKAPGRNGTEVVERPIFAPSRSQPEILAIGASAGGPSALSTLLGGLSADFALPIVIVQHMPDEFIVGLTRWISQISPLPVEIPGHNQVLKPGVVYLAPGSAHLTVTRQAQTLIAQLDYEQGLHRYRPSVNKLLHSVAETCGAASVGVIMTGMGDDGADGLLAMRQAGAWTFAQDKPGCTVFGMPSAAIERGAVERVLALDKLAMALCQVTLSPHN